MLPESAVRMTALQACTFLPIRHSAAVKSQRAVISPEHLVSGFHTRNTLPHLKREGAIYFVTFRLAGTLPADLIQQLKHERETIILQALAAKRPLSWSEQEELFRWYSDRVDACLDAGQGECFLRRPEIADLVAGALCHFDGIRYELRAWVVMPNHVHLVVWPKPPHTLTEILHSWKSYTSSQANKLLDRIGQSFWQTESYDHLIRDDTDLVRCCEYTTRNPVKARICANPEDWKWSNLYRPRG
jgi:REP element-mobilizing transposase RayT